MTFKLYNLKIKNDFSIKQSKSQVIFYFQIVQFKILFFLRKKRLSNYIIQKREKEKKKKYGVQDDENYGGAERKKLPLENIFRMYGDWLVSMKIMRTDTILFFSNILFTSIIISKGDFISCLIYHRESLHISVEPKEKVM